MAMPSSFQLGKRKRSSKQLICYPKPTYNQILPYIAKINPVTREFILLNVTYGRFNYTDSDTDHDGDIPWSKENKQLSAIVNAVPHNMILSLCRIMAEYMGDKEFYFRFWEMRRGWPGDTVDWARDYENHVNDFTTNVTLHYTEIGRIEPRKALLLFELPNGYKCSETGQIYKPDGKHVSVFCPFCVPRINRQKNTHPHSFSIRHTLEWDTSLPPDQPQYFMPPCEEGYFPFWMYPGGFVLTTKPVASTE